MLSLGLSPEQIELRRQGIGGSDAGRLMLGEWKQLWREKMGLAEPEDLSGNLAVAMGSFTEELNAYWYEKVTGRGIGRRSERVVCERNPFMVANLDGMSTTSKGKRAYWDAKHVGRLDEKTVLRYTPQMCHCATIMRVDWWVLSVFVGNSKHELVEQEVDPFYAERLIEMEREFWGYVERGEEPEDRTEPVPAPKPQPALRTVVIDGGTVDGEGFWSAPQDDKHQSWPNWGPAYCKDLATVIRTQGAATANAIARKQIRELVPSDVGEIRRGDTVVKRDKAGALRFTLPGGESDE